jgi:serine/threonine protein kinase
VIDSLLGAFVVMRDCGIQNRDVNPGTIFIRFNGDPVLMDVGSRRDSAGGGNVTAIVADEYRPAESYLREVEHGPLPDIYGMAATLYRAVTGHAPHLPSVACCETI